MKPRDTHTREIHSLAGPQANLRFVAKPLYNRRGVSAYGGRAPMQHATVGSSLRRKLQTTTKPELSAIMAANKTAAS